MVEVDTKGKGVGDITVKIDNFTAATQLLNSDFSCS